MLQPKFWFLLISLFTSANGVVRAEEPVTPSGRGPTTQPTKEFLAALSAPHREAVAAVMRAPTLTTTAKDDNFFAHPQVYDWLLDHPDRASLAWRRLQVPCVEITKNEQGKFVWKDENGSELTWLPVGRFSDGIVWYATGKIKPAALVPSSTVKAVAILKCPRQTIDEKGETATFEPQITIHLQTESTAAAAAMRVMGPAVPRMAEQGAEQILLFFNGPARHIFTYPEEAPKLLAPPTKGK